MRQLFVQVRDRLRTGLSVWDMEEELLLTMLVLYEAGIVCRTGEKLFEQKTEGKKQIAGGVLYSAMHS